eukprot:TRINITY_DN322_c0_g1_i10.p1 TRINITY_DN322_c0_g1~~TRINITY_DN322_c0_g1_i10.p1  ORF type:complete len:317 (-),score=42.14 TRINITY_DN322_c0_g1_i10:100-1050(-)
MQPNCWCFVLAIALAVPFSAQQTVYLGDTGPYDENVNFDPNYAICYPISPTSVVAVSSMTLSFAPDAGSGYWSGCIYDQNWNVIAVTEQVAVQPQAVTTPISATLQIGNYWLCFTCSEEIQLQSSTPDANLEYFPFPWGDAWPNQPQLTPAGVPYSGVYLTGSAGPPPPPPPPSSAGQVALQVLPSAFKDCYLELFEQGIEQMEVTNQSDWILVTFSTALQNLSVSTCQFFNVQLTGSFFPWKPVEYPVMGVTFADGQCDPSVLSSSVAVASGGLNITIVSSCYFYNSAGAFSGSVSISMDPNGNSFPTSILTSFG